MARSLVETGDGSHSLYVAHLDEQYHSRHGALQESLHVFIEMGLRAVPNPEVPLRILEIGFGTGLNALLTLAFMSDRPLRYATVEAFPVSAEEAGALNYVSLLEAEHPKAGEWFEWLHAAEWEAWQDAAGIGFQLFKTKADIADFEAPEPADLVYFDAFAPNKQPELWTEDMFRKMAGKMAPGGILVTYCAKGAVRRAMQAAGLEVERLPGPPGKREMLRATKPLAQN